jgi:hypothetical protein
MQELPRQAQYPGQGLACVAQMWGQNTKSDPLHISFKHASLSDVNLGKCYSPILLRRKRYLNFIKRYIRMVFAYLIEFTSN